jgi:predicted nuclease of predicted toxin-antitoxin system
MKTVLLDENVPVGLGTPLIAAGFEPQHVSALGLKGLSDSALLDATVSSGFDVFGTTDQNLPYQQDLCAIPLAVVVLCTNNWSIIQQHISRICAAIDAARPSKVTVVRETTLRSKR